MLLVLGGLMAAGLASGVHAFGLLGIVLLIWALVVFVMYANLINSLRKSLGRQ